MHSKLNTVVSLIGMALLAGPVAGWTQLAQPKVIPLAGCDQQVLLTAFSADSSAVAVSTNDFNHVYVWDTKTGELLRKLSLEGEDKVGFIIALSPDGKLLASVWGTKVRVWAVETGEPKQTFTANSTGYVAFCAEGKALAFLGNPATMVWDLETGKLKAKWQHRGAGMGDITAPEYISADGKALVTLSDTLEVKDLQSGKVLHTFKLANVDRSPVTVFSPDGLTFGVAHEDGHLSVWNAQSGKHTVLKDISDSGPIALSPGGKQVVSVGARLKGLKACDPGTNAIQWELKDVQVGRCLAFSPNGMMLVSANGKDVSLIK